ncbi:MAG: hypothetical protein SFW36_16505 [Leptolyngbyaceae cyanobacterium bins.59]|nr:hypothetical protein [Leptolyngbyaceae cyanobacterium bins.59]
MALNTLLDQNFNKPDSSHQYLKISLLIAQFRNSIWLFGIPSWVYGISDRGVSAFVDGHLSASEVLQILTGFFFFFSWICLRPDDLLETDLEVSTGKPASPEETNYPWNPFYLEVAQNRMEELQDRHLIGQEYTLSFPYLCQIYHLLNLKHLESVHSFSLGNLKVLTVNHTETTDIGGTVRFQTTVDSALNALRIWRQPIVEAGLTLHTPYTVELTIPAYAGKTITVLFTALPTSENSHKLFIDIYSDLDWPRPILQAILHFSACLTLFEDLPYLQKLADRSIERLFHPDRVSNHETMWLFRRFVELYGVGQTYLESHPVRGRSIAPSLEAA